MTKLEDIKLEVGDKITFDDGEVSYVKKYELNIYSWDINAIVKIERYQKHIQDVIDDSWLYELTTIYERKEILTDEEKDIIRNCIKWSSITNIKKIEKCEPCFLSLVGDDVSDETQMFKDTLFKGMEVDKEYTIEELGL